MICLNCLELLPEAGVLGLIVCQTCDCRYTTEIIEQADLERWNRIALGKEPGVRIERHMSSPPIVTIWEDRSYGYV